MTCRPSFAVAGVVATPASAVTQTFTTTGTEQPFTVPPGVTPGQQLRLPKRARSRYVLRVEILRDSGWTTSYTRSVKT